MPSKKITTNEVFVLIPHCDNLDRSNIINFGDWIPEGSPSPPPTAASRAASSDSLPLSARIIDLEHEDVGPAIQSVASDVSAQQQSMTTSPPVATSSEEDLTKMSLEELRMLQEKTRLIAEIWEDRVCCSLLNVEHSLTTSAGSSFSGTSLSVLDIRRYKN